MRTDLTNKRFGRLLVVKFVGKGKHGEPMWECLCDCGNIKNVSTGHLANGDTRSCGCFYNETRHAINAIHGESKSRLYKIWAGIKSRCYDKQSRSYHKYGQRGIVVCQEWRDSYESFKAWSVANGYTEELTLDRKDNDGNYCPENCRWATQKEQQNNRRNNHLLTYDGETLTVSQWNEKLGFPKGTISQRLNKLGWSVEKALTTKIKQRSNRYA